MLWRANDYFCNDKSCWEVFLHSLHSELKKKIWTSDRVDLWNLNKEILSLKASKNFEEIWTNHVWWDVISCKTIESARYDANTTFIHCNQQPNKISTHMLDWSVKNSIATFHIYIFLSNGAIERARVSVYVMQKKSQDENEQNRVMNHEWSHEVHLNNLHSYWMNKSCPIIYIHSFTFSHFIRHSVSFIRTNKMILFSDACSALWKDH